MGALFVWAKPEPKPPAKVGDRRTVSVFLLWPKCLEGQWRWLGFERVVQEYQSFWSYAPDIQPMDVVGWRAVAWGRSEFKEGSQRTQVKRHGSNGPPPPPPPPPSPPRLRRA